MACLLPGARVHPACWRRLTALVFLGLQLPVVFTGQSFPPVLNEAAARGELTVGAQFGAQAHQWSTATTSESSTSFPTLEVTESPSPASSFAPSFSPSVALSDDLTEYPVENPTLSPSVRVPWSMPPSVGLTDMPSQFPSGTSFPDGLPSTTPGSTFEPTFEITCIPSEVPSTLSTNIVSSLAPSWAPSAAVPATEHPSISLPSSLPSSAPSLMASFPTFSPTEMVHSPTWAPTWPVTDLPSTSPSTVPIPTPSESPSTAPSTAPSTFSPTLAPSDAPSPSPSHVPSTSPSLLPSCIPSQSPSLTPSVAPSVSPSAMPSVVPSVSPSAIPSVVPSTSPSAMPSAAPSVSPSAMPSVVPSTSPSVVPTMFPTVMPSSPTVLPSPSPSQAPSIQTQPIIVVTTFLTLQNVQGNLSSAERLAARQTQAIVLNVSVSQVTIIRVTTSPASSVAIRSWPLARSLSVLLSHSFLGALETLSLFHPTASATATVIESAISLSLLNYPEYSNNVEGLFELMKDVLATSVANGVFLESLVNQSIALSATAFLASGLSVANISFGALQVQLPPTASPSAAPHSPSTLSVEEKAGIILGTAAAIVSIVCASYIWIQTRTGQVPNPYVCYDDLGHDFLNGVAVESVRIGIDGVRQHNHLLRSVSEWEYAHKHREGLVDTSQTTTPL